MTGRNAGPTQMHAAGDTGGASLLRGNSALVLGKKRRRDHFVNVRSSNRIGCPEYGLPQTLGRPGVGSVFSSKEIVQSFGSAATVGPRLAVEGPRGVAGLGQLQREAGPSLVFPVGVGGGGDGLVALAEGDELLPRHEPQLVPAGVVEADAELGEGLPVAAAQTRAETVPVGASGVGPNSSPSESSGVPPSSIRRLPSTSFTAKSPASARNWSSGNLPGDIFAKSFE